VHLEKPRLDGSGTWDADYALDFMRGNVNMSDQFIRFEVNRYLGWPGQAPSYKVGQRIWEQIRDQVREREGADWDVKAFHKRALDIGGVGLDTLRAALVGLGPAGTRGAAGTLTRATGTGRPSRATLVRRARGPCLRRARTPHGLQPNRVRTTPSIRRERFGQERPCARGLILNPWKQPLHDSHTDRLGPQADRDQRHRIR
jgi:hypothetical protein